jgi:MoxR-like ATPase
MEPNSNNIPNWWVFTGTADTTSGGDKIKYKKVIKNIPPWRNFQGESFKDRSIKRGKNFYLDPIDDQILINAINAALYLRKPLIVTGDTGVGKSSLAYAIAYKLGIYDGSNDEEVLTWPITSHTTIKDGLYNYEIVAHINRNTQPVENGSGRPTEIRDYIILNELGTALATPINADNTSNSVPRVLLIDEIDKADMDLPNNLLNILEDGRFYINELNTNNHKTQADVKPQPENNDNQRLQKDNKPTIHDKFGKSIEALNGWVECKNFPIVIITSNGERELPDAFKRRCISVKVTFPSEKKLEKILERQFGGDILSDPDIKELINKFKSNNENQKLGGVDALLNMIQFKKKVLTDDDKKNWTEIERILQFKC